MVLMHGFRSIRYLMKGYAMRFIFSKWKTTGCKVMTTRQYVGLRHADILGHINNAQYIAIFEFARWQALAEAGFNERAIQGKCYPVVASTHCDYFRELSPFCIVTIQTALLGMTSNGRQVVFMQHLYDAKKKLVATALFHISIVSYGNVNKEMSATKGKVLDVKDALKRMGSSPEELFLLGDFEINEIEDVLDKETGELNSELKKIVERVSKNEPKSSYDPSDFKARNDNHNLISEDAVISNTISAVKISKAFAAQKEWFRIGRAKEKKSTEKKKSAN